MGDNYRIYATRQFSQLETGTPNAKLCGEGGIALGKFSGLVRATYFGEVACYDNNCGGVAEGSHVLVAFPLGVLPPFCVSPDNL